MIELTYRKAQGFFIKNRFSEGDTEMKTNKRKLFTVLLVIACLVLITAVFVACNGDLADALKLGTPQNVTINEADFTLKWDAVSGAKSYEVQIDGEVKATAETSYSLKALATEHKVYKIRVKAIAPEDNFLLVDSDFSQEITCEPATYIFNYEANSPLKITGLTAFGLTLETVVIPSKIEGATVTAIGSGAFENNAVMVSVVIPATVATVGDNAFKGATALFSVVFFRDSEEGPTELGEGVFDGATGLTNIIVPEGSSDSYREEIIKTAPELAEVVREKAFESIEITTLPKVAYNAGETLDLSGMAGVLKFSDGSQIPLGNNYSVLLPSGTGGAGSGNRELSVSDTKFTLSVTYGSVTILKEILITVTAPNSNDNQGQAQIGLYNLLTNDLYMGYKFTIPNNNISWGALISGTYLNGNFASLNALIATITTEMLKLTIPKNGT
ncbi:MAG: leucine-rich repeat domain-containing protein, partial [Firmicutes bacterium]|nr:leucine-rich repeat domain-containing protein [Bacillota bacterium]